MPRVAHVLHTSGSSFWQYIEILGKNNDACVFITMQIRVVCSCAFSLLLVARQSSALAGDPWSSELLTGSIDDACQVLPSGDGSSTKGAPLKFSSKQTARSLVQAAFIDRK